MDIAELISEQYAAVSPDTPVSKLVGTFEDGAVTAVVVHSDDFEGIVTRRQLATSEHQPNEKVRSIVRPAPKVAPGEDIRRVAQLMIDGETQLLPVFDGEKLTGVVTADAILTETKPFLEAASVADAYTADLVTVAPESTVGETVHILRENRINHIPVVEEDTAVGIVSIYDVVGLTVRARRQPQGGNPSGRDSFGGELSASSGRTHGGFGAREGELTRLRELPIRDIMISPVRTIHPDATLETAVDEMFAIEGSSLIVTRNGQPFGILTKTDVLDSLTWEAGGNRSVQVYGTTLLDDIQYEDIVAMVEKFDDRDHAMQIIDAKIHLHKHDEKLRGTPLLLARIRLHTDQGLYIASGEGYGASQALHEARDVLERQIRDRKTYDESKKPPGEEFWEKRFGWLLEE